MQVSKSMVVAFVLLGCSWASAFGSLPVGDYAVVVSKKTHDDPKWKAVVDELVAKHKASVIEYNGAVDEALPELKKHYPRYAAFVAQPEEAGRQFVIHIHRLTRKLNDDPYTDLMWGIVTGYSADEALRIAKTNQPLEIERAAGGTGFDLDLFQSGMISHEGSSDEYTEKKPGQKADKRHGEEDAAKPLVDMFGEVKPQLFITSGHATDRDWQIGYPPHKRGQFRCKDGVIYGISHDGKAYPLRSDEPKVFLPAGNCLAGLIRDKQSMAVAWMGSGGVDQMIGYVVSTWYGRGGWGTRNYLFSEPGRYTLSESFYFNNQTLIYELETRFPKTARTDFDKWNIETDPYLIGRLAGQLGYTKETPDLKDNVGLLWDRDTVAFYGDPLWEARIAPKAAPFKQTLTQSGDKYTFTLDADKDCLPGRPPAVLLPTRVKDIEILEGKELKPLVTSNFAMIMEPGKLKAGKTYQVVFKAKAL
jgi:zinc protease